LNKPLRRKDIVKEVGKRIELTQYDLERTESGRVRWEVRVRWAISNLVREGLLDKVERGTYRINEEGLKELRKRSDSL